MHMEKLSYKLETFEGPLDLLLYLISKHKLNIYEIRIADLLDQYLEQMERMQEEELEISSEFLEMAARLVHIKTVSLLPKHEEAEALTRELTGQLIEYQTLKEVAAGMAEQFSFDRFIRQPLPLPADLTYRRTHTRKELYEAYQNAVGRGKRLKALPDESSFSGIVPNRRSYVSVTSRIVHVLRRLWDGAEVRYLSLFGNVQNKSGIVATFLALLELIHGKRVSLSGEGTELTVKLENGGGKHWKSRKHRVQ